VSDGDPFIEAVKRGSAKLAATGSLPWWALVSAGSRMRNSDHWTRPDMKHEHSTSLLDEMSGEIGDAT